MTAARDTLPPPPADLVIPSSALFLDADGTLLAFADDPEGVVVADGLLDTLDALHQMLGGALALVSGRTIAQPRWHLRPDGPGRPAGQHGLERRDTEGRTTIRACRRRRVRTPAQARARGRRGSSRRARGGQDLVGRAALSRAPRVRRRTQTGSLPRSSRAFRGFELQPGNYVYEFKPRGVDKGLAVDAFLESPPFRGRMPVYLGDDLTDEHAFAVVNDHGGASVRVGARNPTQATFTLSSPADVQAWLDAVKATLMRGAASAR